MKRDDLSGDIGLGGNKVRKLEYLLADALEQGATHVLTTGGPQSNHARATAAAAARLGLKAVLVLAGRDPGVRMGNLLLDQLFGAEIQFPGARTAEEQAAALTAAAAKLRDEGHAPYIVPIGGSNPLGTLGAYDCMAEMADALPKHSWVCCASGSGGTHAGIALGAQLLAPSVRVQGFSVWQSAAYLGPITTDLMERTGSLMGQTVALEPPLIDDQYRGPRYGHASLDALEAIRLLASLEGVLLDHVYTGKAMAGLLDYIRKGIIKPASRVTFIHTGGAPALFARKENSPVT